MFGKDCSQCLSGVRRLVWLSLSLVLLFGVGVLARLLFLAMALSMLFCLLSLASALQPQRMTHRKTLDGPTSACSGCGVAVLDVDRVGADPQRSLVLSGVHAKRRDLLGLHHGRESGRRCREGVVRGGAWLGGQ